MPFGYSRRVRSAICAASCGWVMFEVRLATRPSVEMPSTMSSGSRPLPFVLDIFAPSASRTMPWMYTLRNGTSPVKRKVIMIMRATQKKMMS